MPAAHGPETGEHSRSDVGVPGFTSNSASGVHTVKRAHSLSAAEVAAADWNVPGGQGPETSAQNLSEVGEGGDASYWPPWQAVCGRPVEMAYAGRGSQRHSKMVMSGGDSVTGQDATSA